MTLHPTSLTTTTVTVTTYQVPRNTAVLATEVGDHPGTFRPTVVTVTEQNNQVTAVTFTGPRQVPTGNGSRADSVATDTATRTLSGDALRFPLSTVAPLLTAAHVMHRTAQAEQARTAEELYGRFGPVR